MKLSEAIRLGAMSAPQAFRSMASVDGGLCALGAAYRAVGVITESDMKYLHGLAADGGKTLSRAHVAAVLPLVYLTGGNCPECSRDHDCIGSVVIHLNDRHHWTREQIADWVESVERQHAQAPAETPEAVTV